VRTPLVTTTTFAVAVAFGGPVLAQSSSALTSSATVVITSEGDKLGTGLIQQEDQARARSNVSRAAVEKALASSNPFQLIDLLPGVSTFSHDPTGMFGGGLQVRGFNSDQLGFTIDGVPVNDSGNFAVYPQEYTDSENLCQLTVTQGTVDIDSPHVGATTGNINIFTCEPELTRRARVAQSVGSLGFRRSFVRFDTGKFAEDRATAFISYSNSFTRKWKGPGNAQRDHVDAKVRYDLGGGASVSTVLLWNYAINHNILSMSKAQLAQNGRNWDYAPSFVGHLPGGSGAQIETSPFPPYYRLSTNPFENAIVRINSFFPLNDKITLKVDPYFWYGFGTGGSQQRIQSESQFLNTATNLKNAQVDLNGDGDKLDTILISSSSVTRTHRPGVVVSINQVEGSHNLSYGIWYERAHHIQTGPGVLVNSDGSPTDYWLRAGSAIRRPDGSLFQRRDYETISTASQVFLQDTYTVTPDKTILTLGLRTPKIERAFTNRPNEGQASPIGYEVVKTYSRVLPSLGLRHQLSNQDQIFAQVTQGFRAPPNFALDNYNIVNGKAVLSNAVKAETSTTIDVGYRYFGSMLTASATAFMIDFRNRQANGFDPELNKSSYVNVGGVKARGFEFELGTRPIQGFSAYASFSLNDTEIQNNLPFSATYQVPVAGKEFPLAPKQMAGLSMQYSNGPGYVQLKAKRTGKMFTSLMNDEGADGYTAVDLNAGYRVGNLGFGRVLTVRFNILNLFDKEYMRASGLVVNAKAITSGATTLKPADTVFYYLSAPRFTGLTLTVDF
jgi:iron complex outermembrane receptor protein